MICVGVTERVVVIDEVTGLVGGRNSTWSPDGRADRIPNTSRRIPPPPPPSPQVFRELVVTLLRLDDFIVVVVLVWADPNSNGKGNTGCDEGLGTLSIGGELPFSSSSLVLRPVEDHPSLLIVLLLPG